MGADFSLREINRHGIEPARTKRLTPEQAQQRQPRSATRAVPLNRFLRVMRAPGMKAAGAGKEWGEKILVAAHGEEAEPDAQTFSGGTLSGGTGFAVVAPAEAVKAPRSRPSSSSVSGPNFAVATEPRG